VKARNSKPAVVDLFAGAGLFSYSFCREGFRTVFAIEQDAQAAATYARNLGTHIVRADVRHVKPSGECDVLIGVTRDGVEGCDLGDISGSFQFSETHYLSNATVTNSYKEAIYNLVLKTNNATFKGFATGTVLFLGCSGGRRGAGDWEITFKFAARPDVEDACANWPSTSGFGYGHGDGAVKIPVPAWHYMWVFYHDVKDAGLSIMVKRPRHIYVERIYESVSFSTLGIGTT
jgi:hypothetical protein